MDYYQKTKNAILAGWHFGISRQLFYYWLKNYHPYNLATLENQDKTQKKETKRDNPRIRNENCCLEKTIMYRSKSFFQCPRFLKKTLLSLWW